MDALALRWSSTHVRIVRLASIILLSLIVIYCPNRTHALLELFSLRIANDSPCSLDRAPVYGRQRLHGRGGFRLPTVCFTTSVAWGLRASYLPSFHRWSHILMERRELVLVGGMLSDLRSAKCLSLLTVLPSLNPCPCTALASMSRPSRCPRSWGLCLGTAPT